MVAFPPPTNEVTVAYLQSIQTSAMAAQSGYLRGQVDRLQHEVNFLEQGILIFFSLFVLTLAALLLERNRRLRTQTIVRETGVRDDSGSDPGTTIQNRNKESERSYETKTYRTTESDNGGSARGHVRPVTADADPGRDGNGR